LLATVWPAASAKDSDLQRRKKLAVRTGHLTMAVMAAAAVAGTLIVEFRQSSGARLASLAAVDLIYIT